MTADRLAQALERGMRDLAAIALELEIGCEPSSDLVDALIKKSTPESAIGRMRDALAQAPAEGDGMLEPLIYAAMMHNGKPKTVAEFERAAANVADMLQRRAEVTHNKPAASIYISDDGSREFDDWRVDLPPGNHQLFTAPRPGQPQPESLPHPGSPEADKMLDALLAEYGQPVNMKNAARAGYMAARRLLQHARQPLPATDDAEPNVQPKGMQAAPESEAIRMAYKTGYDEGYSDASDGMVDHDAAEEGWQQYREALAPPPEPTAFVHWPLNGPPRLVWYSNKALHAAIEASRKAQNGHVPDLLLYAAAPSPAPAPVDPMHLDWAVGGAINKFFAGVDNGDGTIAFDHCNSDDIDALVGEVLTAVAAAQAPAVVAENDTAEFEVWEGDELYASASGPRAQAWAEVLRYADQCYGGGVVRVFEVSRVERTADESDVPVQGTESANG